MTRAVPEVQPGGAVPTGPCRVSRSLADGQVKEGRPRQEEQHGDPDVRTKSAFFPQQQGAEGLVLLTVTVFINRYSSRGSSCQELTPSPGVGLTVIFMLRMRTVRPWKDLPSFQKLHNYLKQSPDWTGGSEGSPRAAGGGQICGPGAGVGKPGLLLRYNAAGGAVQTLRVPKRPGLALWPTKALSAEPWPWGRALRPGAGGALWGWGSGKGAGVGPGKREMRKEGRARPGWAAPREMTGRRCRGGEGDAPPIATPAPLLSPACARPRGHQEREQGCVSLPHAPGRRQECSDGRQEDQQSPEVSQWEDGRGGQMPSELCGREGC